MSLKYIMERVRWSLRPKIRFVVIQETTDDTTYDTLLYCEQTGKSGEYDWREVWKFGPGPVTKTPILAKIPVFVAGEILVVDRNGREIGGLERSPCIWQIQFRYFRTVRSAVKCSHTVQRLRFPELVHRSRVRNSSGKGTA